MAPTAATADPTPALRPPPRRRGAARPRRPRRRRPEEGLVAGVARYVDPDTTTTGAHPAPARRAGPTRCRAASLIEADEPALVVGHHSFPAQPESRPTVLTPAQAAQLLQVDEDAVLALAEEGRLPGRRIGDEWRFAAPRPRVSRPAHPGLTAEANEARGAPLGCRGVPPAARIMGIVNVTLDSFSDGGEWFGATRRSPTAGSSSDEGAASSTSAASRPGRAPIPSREEGRSRAVLRSSRRSARRATESASTPRRPRSRERRWDAGATFVNDVTALATTPRWPASSPTPAATAASCTCSASRGRCRSTRATATSSTTSGPSSRSAAFAVGEGIAKRRIPSTPGSGSARPSTTTSSSCAASTRSSRSASRWSSARRASPSSGGLTGREDPHERVVGTVATSVIGARARGHVFRSTTWPPRGCLKVAAARCRPWRLTARTT